MRVIEGTHPEPERPAPGGRGRDPVFGRPLGPADPAHLVSQQEEGLDLAQVRQSRAVLEAQVVEEHDAQPVAALQLLAEGARLHDPVMPFWMRALSSRSSGR